MGVPSASNSPSALSARAGPVTALALSARGLDDSVGVFKGCEKTSKGQEDKKEVKPEGRARG